MQVFTRTERYTVYFDGIRYFVYREGTMGYVMVTKDKATALRYVQPK